MKMEEIHLTPEELEEIKDDYAFKKLTLWRLKKIEQCLNGGSVITRLQVYVKILYALVIMIIGALVRIGLSVLK